MILPHPINDVDDDDNIELLDVSHDDQEQQQIDVPNDIDNDEQINENSYSK